MKLDSYLYRLIHHNKSLYSNNAGVRMDSREHDLSHFVDDKNLNMMELSELFEEFLTDIYDRHHMQYRRLSLNGSAPVMEVRDQYTGLTKEMINLASNDYLNLTKHPKTIQAGVDALLKYGSGSGGAPLFNGTFEILNVLERKLAILKGCESSVVFTNGYGAFGGTIACLLKENDVAILDICDHASIIDGCKKAKVEFFRHNNMNSLESVLSRVRNQFRNKLVIVDGVFSMDGDISKLDNITELAHNYGAYVMCDEAHATGVIGDNGRGTPEYYHIDGKVDIVAGTLSKALGSVGGFIAGPKGLIEYIRYYARSSMFSTGPTPQSIGSLIAAIDVIENEPHLRKSLWLNIDYFKSNLLKLGFNIGNSETAIFPLIIGDDMIVKDMCRELHENDIYVNPVVYPAVQRKSARIRMSLMANHTQEHLDTVLDKLEYFGKKYKVI
jgi:glycine C-acetyltransferase